MPTSFLQHRFNVLFLAVSLVSFALIVLRAKMTPFTHDETATFYFIVQNGHYMPYHAHLDTNNHILNSMLTHVCYSLMGSSKFVLRIPNIVFFVVLLIGLFRITKHLRTNLSRILLLCAFIFSYNWFTFFSVSRGYGISFASMIMAISFLLDYFMNAKVRSIVFAYFFMQLALASSLIMLPVFCIMIGLVSIHQLLNRQFFTIRNILNLIINAALILYWVKFSSYLKEQNGLTHGAGESYWQVTFVTLIYMVTGSYKQWLQALLVVSSLLLLGTGIFYFFKKRPELKNSLSQPYFFFLVMFLAEIIGIYLMKKLMHVNYPEDRTALFFYLTLLMFAVFLVDKMDAIVLNYVAIVISATLFIQFALKLNFRKHELYIYDTFPSRFYDKLLSEQKNYTLPITIGGHRCREFIYGFMNYRSDGALNAMFAPELLHMNCDYLVAKAGEKPFYERYYEEIDSEPDWDFRLLKRKDKIDHQLQMEIKDKHFTGSNEFYELLNDTSNTLFPNKNPVRADFTFKVNKVPVPFQAWLVVQIDSINGNKHCFSRSSLNWIKLNFNNDKEYTYSVVTPSLPNKYKCIKAFLWNIKSEPIDLTFTSLKLYQMHGKGINYVAPIYY